VDGGWAHFFTKTPARTPQELKTAKLFTWAGDDKYTELWKGAGFNAIPLPATEISTALQTGLVNALCTTPQVAAVMQWYNNAKNMTDLPWQLLLGATIISKGTWEKIPAEMRPGLLEAAREGGRRLQEEIRKSGDKDVEAMRKRGLNVVPVDARARDMWRQTAERMYPRIRGAIVPADAFDEALRYRDEYRKRSGGSR
jgi:TRAP-type C4-dicarboxylate transport system substrate-binding protein